MQNTVENQRFIPNMLIATVRWSFVELTHYYFSQPAATITTEIHCKIDETQAAGINGKTARIHPRIIKHLFPC